MKIGFVSLAARNALIYFILFITGLGLSGLIMFEYSSKEVLALTEDGLEHTGEMVGLKFDTYLENIETDLNQLAGSPLLNRFLQYFHPNGIQLLTDEYVSFLNHNPNYFQVRLISASNGDEIIRVERQADQVYTLSKSELQNKADRDYFQEIIALPTDSTYFSKIDLNKEQGQISHPSRPTLRIAKMLPIQIKKGIIIIINVDLNSLFTELKDLLPETYKLRMLDQDGHYFIHPNVEQEFTFEFNKPAYFQKEFHDQNNIDAISNQILKTDSTLNIIKKLHYQRPSYDVFTIISANNTIILSSFYAWRNKVILGLVIIAVAFLLIAYAYMRHQVTELKTISKQLVLFSEQPEPQQLQIYRNDEIGDLAKGFEQMSRTISENHEQIKKAKKNVEIAYKEKEEFLENMSHEIRTPLQSILGSVNILQQNNPTSQQEPLINSLKFSTSQLNSLVTDILDYSKIKRGLIELDPQWIELEQFSNELLHTLKYQLSTKKINIKVEYTKEIKGKSFYFDGVRLYQILNNLLINALKFTNKNGNITFKIDYLEADNYRFSITDNGIGISENEITKILDRNVTSDYTDGSGLGLTIVKQLLLLNHSNLEIESTIGEGSQFHFLLSLPSKTNITTYSEGLQIDTPTKANTKILVIEDDAELLNWYQYLLKDFDLTLKDNPEFTENDKGQFDFIISDLHFKNEKKDSVEYLKALKQYIKTTGSILIISAAAQKLKIESVYSLKKPVKKEQIMSIITKTQLQLIWGQPDFSNLERDYDNKVDLINNAVSILINEWQRDSQTLKIAILNNNEVSINMVRHRIITSIRRLQLHYFETYIENLTSSITTKKQNYIAFELSEMFKYYLESMANYKA